MTGRESSASGKQLAEGKASQSTEEFQKKTAGQEVSHAFHQQPAADVKPPIPEDIKLALLLPEEVWMQVLDKLDDTTKTSVNSGIPFFRRLLRPERNLFLFPAVMNVIYDKLEVYCYYEAMRKYKQAKEESSDEDVDIREVGPTLLLKLRQVCRKWCQVVDEAFQEKCLHRHIVRNSLNRADYYLSTAMPASDTDSLLEWTERHGGCEKLDEGVMTSFLDHFGGSYPDSQRNPFFGRTLTLQLYVRTTNEQILDMFKILKSFGGHVWCCTVIADYYWAVTVRDMLSMMPNLRQLFWKWFDSQVHRWDASYELMNEEMARVAFPTLSNLKCVRFEAIPIGIIRSFMEVNSHVQVFQPVNPRFCMRTSLTFDIDASLPNLSQMSIRMDFEDVHLFAQLEMCARNWRLAKFELVFRTNRLPPVDDYIKWKRVLQVLQAWRNSLTDVLLEAPPFWVDSFFSSDSIVWDPNDKLEIDLPKVKRLCLKSLAIDMPNLFLPLSGSLETLVLSELRVFNSEPKPRRPGRQVMPDASATPPYERFEWQQLEAANLWQMFPNLKRVEFEEGLRFKICSRPV